MGQIDLGLIRGPAGKSAYQYAVDGGYAGTEAEFQALMASGPWVTGKGSLASESVDGPLALTVSEQRGATVRAGVDWNEVTLPFYSSLRCVVYGGSVFLAVGNSEYAYSTDGIIWTSSYIFGTIRSVTYGRGKFTAVGDGGACYQSEYLSFPPDFRAQSHMPNANWSSVAYGDENGAFVAVAKGSDVAAYTKSNVDWTAATMPSIADWSSITYGNGKFVAVASNSDKAAYSEDGVTWTAATLPKSAEWTTVTYGMGKFIALAKNSGFHAISTDGIEWGILDIRISEAWSSITYGNGKFVAMAKDCATALYSTDGIRWLQMELDSAREWSSVTYGNGKFVAVASNTDKASYSVDEFLWLNVNGKLIGGGATMPEVETRLEPLERRIAQLEDRVALLST